MKALTLTQPWASLVAIGAKTFETRSWSTNYRGPVVIHAAKGFPTWAKTVAADLSSPIHRALVAGDIFSIVDLKALCSHVLCIVDIVDCIQITVSNVPPGDEYYFGDYTPGRYMWKLENLRRIEPVLAKGALGLWNINLCQTCGRLDCTES